MDIFNLNYDEMVANAELIKSEIQRSNIQKIQYNEQLKSLPPLNKPSPSYNLKQFQIINRPIEEVFKFFSDAKNLEKITPEVLNFKILKMSTDKVQEGSVIDYQLKLHGIPLSWKTIITEWEDNAKFVDYQESGPYKVWYHRHLFFRINENETLMVDDVDFVLPLGALGRFFAGWYVKADVSKIFKFRYDILNKVWND